MIGSRKRKYINSAGNTNVLIIRRLRCQRCRSIHHELPDILVPYKRYDSESIESVLDGKEALNVAADESTIHHWQAWFAERVNHFLGCLVSICIKLGRTTVKNISRSPKSRFQRVIEFVGDASGWLARIVRPVANTNNWIHTRSAFLS